ncbi:MAG TPA: isocitrate/isopropylmalate family dehydrogenase, partial [Kribbella sp.]|nr:isocitrate/isopropylmalate family dehydrogenase [Kribbella sp.]
MTAARIVVLAGDGTGPEVTDQALEMLMAVADLYGHSFVIRPGLVGQRAIAAEGAAISDATLGACAE